MKLETELLERLKRAEKAYNPQLGLLRIPNQRTYHTSLSAETHPYVHGVYESAVYALDLLDSGVAGYEQRSFEILRAVIDLQDKDLGSATYGIWPYFYEESVQQMKDPDRNMADFVGWRFVLILKRHRNRLPTALLEQLRQAILRSCQSIMRRPVEPDYTNIFLMGAFVTLVGGEQMGDEAIAAHGLNRLERMVDYTRRIGTFTEYNSPHYNLIALDVLRSIYMEVSNPDGKRLSGELIRLIWEMIARHYHPSTGQWSGPHSRSYRTLLEPGTWEHDTLKGALETDAWPDGVRCPDDLLHCFEKTTERHIREPIFDEAKKGYQCMAVTYMCEDFSLGTFSREIMWNQRRNLIAYLDNNGKPAYVHLRFLKDGRDFSSAVFTSVQDKGDVLYGINIATDGGDWHPELDPVNGRFRAKDLRIRLEIGGETKGIRWSKGAPSGFDVTVGIGRRTLGIRKVACVSDMGEPDLAVTERNGHGTIGIDFVIYSGPERRFDFHEWQAAAWIFYLTLTESMPERVDVLAVHGVCSVCCRKESQTMSVSLKVKPDRVQTLLRENQSELKTD